MAPEINIKHDDGTIVTVKISGDAAREAAEAINAHTTNNLIYPGTQYPYPGREATLKELSELKKSLLKAAKK